MPAYVHLGDEVILPKVEGFNIIEAQKILDKNGFKMIIKERKHHYSLPDGTVMTQNPAAGTRVKQGRKVNLVISMGEKPVIVPDFSGYNQEQARIRCQEIGLTLSETRFEFNNNYARNIVFNQSLEPNTEVKRETEIDLTVSMGKNPMEKFTVPNYVGWPFDKAKKDIDEKGLIIRSIIPKTSLDILPNTVVRQVGLKPNMEAFPGDSIDLVITK